IAKRTLTDAGIAAEHRQGMGGTIILWEALRSGQIGVYPEYTGTITQEILKRTDELTFEQIANELGKAGIGMTEPLGFNNTYALVMRRVRASELGIRTITDLQNHPELKFGLTHEFLDRKDGWRPLAQHYQLNPQNVIGIDHALGYSALVKASIDVKDAYSTDAKISENDLVVLEDDRQFFPQYKAVFLFRFAVPEPAISALRKLEGTIDEAKMTRLNAEAERTKNCARVIFRPLRFRVKTRHLRFVDGSFQFAQRGDRRFRNREPEQEHGFVLRKKLAIVLEHNQIVLR